LGLVVAREGVIATEGSDVVRGLMSALDQMLVDTSRA
jgi:hypothetical protein